MSTTTGFQKKLASGAIVADTGVSFVPNKANGLHVRVFLGLLIVAQLLLSTNAHSQDDLASRRAAAERYEATMPMAKMMDESIQQMALSLPNDQQNTFIMMMRQVVDGERLRIIGLDKMIEVFTAEELNALAAFYGSSVGQSIVAKFPVYMAEVLPLIQLDIVRAVRELEHRSR